MALRNGMKLIRIDHESVLLHNREDWDSQLRMTIVSILYLYSWIAKTRTQVYVSIYLLTSAIA